MKCPCFVEAFLKYLSENQVLADWTVPVKHQNIQAWEGGKSSCKITPCMHFLRQFKSSFKMYLRCAGERIISVCCETGLYPGAGDQPQVPPRQGDVGVAEPSPGWYPAGLALCSIARVPVGRQHKTHREEGDFPWGKMPYLKQTNRAETASEAAFWRLPLLAGKYSGNIRSVREPGALS